MIKDKQDGRPSHQKAVVRGTCSLRSQGLRWFHLWYYRGHFNKVVTWPGVYFKGVLWLTIKNKFRTAHNGDCGSSYSEVMGLSWGGANDEQQCEVSEFKISLQRPIQTDRAGKPSIAGKHLQTTQEGVQHIWLLLSSCFSLVAY